MANPFIWLLGLPRDKKRWLMVAADLMMLPLALWSAFMLRFAQPFPPVMQSAWWLFFVIPLAGVFVFSRLGLYRAVVRYMGWRAIASVSIGVTIVAVVVFVGTLFTEARTCASIPLIFAAVAFFYVGGSRFFVRAWYQMLTHARGRGAEPSSSLVREFPGRTLQFISRRVGGFYRSRSLTKIGVFRAA
jgi:FlaA1/EpsC-like NDP-sugar epimerase